MDHRCPDLGVLLVLVVTISQSRQFCDYYLVHYVNTMMHGIR